VKLDTKIHPPVIGNCRKVFQGWRLKVKVTCRNVWML